MNLAYYRKSKYDKETTINNLISQAEKEGLENLGSVELKKANATFLQLCSKEWLEDIVDKDKNVIGLLPCGVIVIEKDQEIIVGGGNPSVLGSVTQNEDIHRLGSEAEKKMRKIINEGTGSGELKPASVKLFSTKSCPYCKMEKEWLDDNKVEHQVVYVDQDQKEAQRMVQATGQMGVPVTEIEYEDMEAEFVVGFNKQQLSSMLGI